MEKSHEITGKNTVVEAQAVYNPFEVQASAPEFVGASNSDYISLNVEDEPLLKNEGEDFAVTKADSSAGRREAYDTADTIVRTNVTRKKFLDPDEEAAYLSKHSSKAEARQINEISKSANNIHVREVRVYEDEATRGYGKTKFDNVDDSAYKTNYSIPKTEIGAGYKFSSDSYKGSEYKFSSD